MDEKKPMKAKKLKIIDHMGTYYATFDGSKIWKVEKWIFNLLMMCNGKKTYDEIAQEIVTNFGLPFDDVRKGLIPIFEELERDGLIVNL
jgi:hypothetical protein